MTNNEKQGQGEDKAKEKGKETPVNPNLSLPHPGTRGEAESEREIEAASERKERSTNTPSRSSSQPATRSDQTTDPFCLRLLGQQLNDARLARSSHTQGTPQIPNLLHMSNPSLIPTTGPVHEQRVETTATKDQIQEGQTIGSEKEATISKNTSTLAENNPLQAITETSKQMTPLGPGETVTWCPDDMEEQSVILTQRYVMIPRSRCVITTNPVSGLPGRKVTNNSSEAPYLINEEWINRTREPHKVNGAER